MTYKPSINNTDLHEIAKSIKQKRDSSPEFANSSNKEILKNIVKEKYGGIDKRDTYTNNNLSNGNQIENVNSNQNESEMRRDEDMLPDYAKNIPEETRNEINNLIDLTFKKGISAGLKMARLADPYIMDLYHDALVDKLIVKLQEKKLV